MKGMKAEKTEQTQIVLFEARHGVTDKAHDAVF